MNAFSEEVILVYNLSLALRREITKNMRAVLVRRIENRIDIRFISYDKPDEDEIESMGYIGTEVLSHYNEDVEYEHYNVIPTGVIPLKEGEISVFERKEEIS